jgi:predicted phosphodiesterase
MAKRTKNRYVLCISDTHLPYSHPDNIPFLKAIANEYPIDRVLHMGDETDKHSLSFHDADQELFSAGHELEESKKFLKEYYKLFPVVDVMESNHGSMVYRKAKHHGIPLHYIKDYADVLEAPDGWKWHADLTITLSNGQECYFCHGIGADVKKVSQAMGMNVVQGHYHNTFKIDYWSNPNNLFWGMQVGCSIDDKSLAFAYNKNSPKRPIIGHGIIIEGQPRLLPMILNKKGRWTGFVP